MLHSTLSTFNSSDIKDNSTTTPPQLPTSSSYTSHSHTIISQPSRRSRQPAWSGRCCVPCSCLERLL
ncbi:hypothetical protein E2C01_050522 [Portunus trituberculatus]|uniref:Uncharacterized protein n=1 Tax=Portunus trituberculatus TaxID=210409 RepID=A0A5B7G8I1_PORTR|nr:hypothetical protein [Portunus trituberculatus]